MTDCDGVLTDGGMYYASDGTEMKRFNTRDGMGFQLLREKGIKTGIVTGENTPIVTNRAKKLQLDEVVLGCKDKLAAVQEQAKKYELSMDEVAYIGDDINDIAALEWVGFAACPNDAVEAVKQIPGIHVLSRKGGTGCVRELVEKIIKEIHNEAH